MESLNDALVECVKACGGSANVGPKLWPEKTRDAAQRALLDCLSPDRPAKLSPEQVLFILRLSRDKGCHVGIDFVLTDLSYAPAQPIEPRDEAGELMREYIAAVADSKKHADRMERIAQRLSSTSMRAVA